jgi:hypothetical protein
MVSGFHLSPIKRYTQNVNGACWKLGNQKNGFSILENPYLDTSLAKIRQKFPKPQRAIFSNFA